MTIEELKAQLVPSVMTEAEFEKFTNRLAFVQHQRMVYDHFTDWDITPEDEANCQVKGPLKVKPLSTSAS